MHLTFLHGTSPTYQPSKSFSLEATGIVEKSAYDIGYTFHNNSFAHTEDLSVIAETIRNYALAGWFRINGQPAQHVLDAPATPVRRLSENFPEVPTRFASFDLDDVPIPVTIASKALWSLSDPSTTANVIRDLLMSMGWRSLAYSDFVFLLTSKQFTRDTLRAHLYFVFEKGRSLEEMRALAVGFNTYIGSKIFDPAPYNPVQPDYIAPPRFINFTDPIPASARIFYSKGLSALVPEQLLATDINTNTPKGWSTSRLVDKLGRNWLETIQLHVGTELGINNPAFRAAAQLVNEVGKQQVINNIDTYAKEMHDESWKAILSHGKRGDASDRQTYDVARFKQYLESATRQGKQFGTEVDKLVAEVSSAVDHARNGDITMLCGRQVVQTARLLREKYPAAWATAKINFRKQLRGVITVAEYEKLIKATSLPAPQASNTLIGTEVQLMEEGQNENNLIRPILDTYEFIIDQDGNDYVIPPGDHKKVLPLTGDISNTFYRDGLLRSNNAVSLQFGKKCTSVLFADKSNPMQTAVKFQKDMVGRRVIPLGDSIAKGCWYNAGYQDDGVHRSIHISPAGPVIHDNIKTPRWVDVASNILPTIHAFKEKFAEETEPTPDFLINFYKQAILDYICCEQEDLESLTSWLVTALTNRPLAYIGEFIGPYNCGKSTGADLAKDLIDPVIQPLGSGASRSVFSGKTDENFFALLSGQLITIIDNVGILTPQVQDVLCQVSTGMKYNLRIMYTQTQLEQYLQRPIILTGLSKIITRPDLASRTMTINFLNTPRFNPNFIRDWYIDKPFIFGGLIHIASRVMKQIAETKPEDIGQVSQREIVYAAVSSVLAGGTVIDSKSVTDRNVAQYLEQVASSEFCLALFAFFQELGDTTYEISTSDFRDAIRNWVEANRGMQKVVILGDEVQVYNRQEFRVTYNAIPKSAVSFGWSVNKFHHAFEKLSGWHMERYGRSSKGNIRRYVKKICLTNIF